MTDFSPYLQIKLSGDIATKGEVNLRDLANTYTHLQSMIDRAFIDITTKGKIRKHSRLKGNQYGEIFFSVGDPKRSSYLVDLISKTQIGQSILNRINEAIAPVYNVIETSIGVEYQGIYRDLNRVKGQIDQGQIAIMEYNEEEILNKKYFARSFGDKSILKYMDQLVTPTRARDKENYIDLTISTEKTIQLAFNKEKGKKFHHIVTNRTLGLPYTIEGQLVKADWHNRQGSFVKYTNGRKCNLKFSTREEVEELSHLMGAKGIKIVVCPIIEFGSYDVASGDLLFVKLIDSIAA